ncbi:UbiA family prenyltransferase [Chloroflexota bacterium]
MNRKIWIKTRGLLHLIRLKNCFMVGFAVIISETVALGGDILAVEALLGFLSAFSLVASAMSLNDYFDLEVDRINSPKRPVPSGIVTTGEAIVYTLILGSLGLAISFLIDPGCFVLAFLALALMAYYNRVGKRTGLPGNLVVSCCVALPFIYGGFAVGDVKSILWIFATLAFVSNTGREVVKGIADIRGDIAKEIRTIAAIRGNSFAGGIATTFFAAAVALSLVPLTFDSVSILYLPFVVASDIGFVYSSISIIRDNSPGNARITKNMVLIWMLLGLIAFLAGSY